MKTDAPRVWRQAGTGLPERRVLLVEDDPEDALIVRELLREPTRTRFDLEWVSTFADALEAIREDRHDAYLIDLYLGEHEGIELLREAVARGVRGPVIMLTGQNSAAIDETAERSGASDYLIKGRTDALLLERSIRYAIGRRQAELRQRFLSGASGVLTSSLDLDETLHAVTRLGLPLLGDYCLLYYVDPTAGESRLVGAHVDPRLEEMVRVVERTYRPDLENPHSVMARVHRTGVSARTDAIPDDALVALAQSPEQLEAFRALGGGAGLVVPLVARGETRGVMALSRSAAGGGYDDDTQRLAEELARRAALTIDNAALYRRAQEAKRLRDDVLAIVSHDLRNPVTTVLMSASFMLDDLTPECLSDTVRQQLGVIKRAAGRMRRLLDDLLDVARIDAGHLSLQVQPTELPPVLAEVCEGFQGQVATAGQRLVCELAQGLPHVAADRERLIQVLGNLVGNAVKVAPSGTSIVLAARHAGDEIQISVADSGPGIPTADIAHLFERFWQKRAGDRTGAGLGLAITKAIVERHAGRIWIESRVGAGTTVHFTIPVWAGAKPAERADASRTSNVRPQDVEAIRVPP